ncbi:MAG: hypothetical protein UU51_C0018G0003 [Microgenomates group bacterium GW2011_GWC1_41_20]|uniref:2'-5' RNA ligase n=7 Tax=Candidatus Woeseibacteriota TaxID=1752722 RepID=A0A0G0UYK2_9BACT|nr:MAG: hypothetical protein UT76_C0027G0005 [Candidatus Woesebacteria bacterium GW2011_GWB1_40_12]KKR55422.1 MAG: hypothetical protein UT93_C0023G0003 [Candidatus Woesebacteria bacterium GW2011_GWF1_40_24]KKR89773.1 MAG: hypothetical protein UU39_C0026G0007 [Candidatus Woesebacteria bacterium GW2011_GWD1_41_12]KKS00109.1 MAG: hypothetical protein UU51_C0018G0003 [Microgenomates group bacterium GW2011_GWC1_41_20]KKS04467.1 MAG: hypothetical protein UU57_C0020G0003 [Candidatus Woesebacteria bact
MKELSLGETYNKTYVAIPITESPLFSWVQSINGNKKFYHITILFLGKIEEEMFPKIKEAMLSIPESGSFIPIIPEKLGFLGEKRGLFALKIKRTDELEKIRETLDKALPKNEWSNFNFLPHVTIKTAKRGEFSKHDRERLLEIYDRSKLLDPYKAETVGLYYRTEEGSTALLFKKKL